MPAQAVPAVTVATHPLAVGAPQVSRQSPARGMEWVGKLHCDPFNAGRRERPAFEEMVPVQLENGAFVLQRRPLGMGGHFRIQGTPASDGSLLLTGVVIAPQGRRKGEELPVRLEGRLDAGRYVTNGYLGGRACSLEIAKR